MKKTATLSALFCFLSTFLMAQNSKVKFGISFNTNYSQLHELSNQQRFDVGKMSYSIGIFREMKLNQQWSYRGGLNFKNTGYQTVKIKGTWEETPNGLTPIIDATFTFDHYYLESPLDFQYFLDKKKHFFLNMGISTMIQLRQKETFTRYFPNDKTITSVSNGYRSNNIEYGFGFQLGIGYSVKLNQKLSLDIQPKCQYSFTTIENIIGTTPNKIYNLGVEMGLKF